MAVNWFMHFLISLLATSLTLHPAVCVCLCAEEMLLHADTRRQSPQFNRSLSGTGVIKAGFMKPHAL